MAKEPVDTVQASPADAAPMLALDEFCTRLSETVRSPELIGGFHSSEAATGLGRDTAEAYQARFAAFCNKPV